MSSLISLFRQHYPQGSLCCDLIDIDRGLYIVQASVTVEGVMLATALSAQAPLEVAEDLAKERVLMTLNLPPVAVAPSPPPPVTPPVPAPEVPPQGKTRPSKKVAQPAELIPEVVTKPQPEAEVAPPPPIVAPEPAAVVAPPTFPPSPDPEPILPVQEPLLDLVTEVAAPAPAQPDLPPELPSLEQSPLPLTTATPSPEPVAETTDEPIDFSEIIARSNLELKRLGWTNEQGKNYLLQTYGKRSRQLLSDEQLIEFLAYLEQQPTPMA